MKTASRLIHLISKKKTNCTCSTLFLLMAKKKKFARAARFFVFSSTLFCTTKTSSVLGTHYFYGEIVVCACLPNIFFCCLHVRFYFSLPLIFTLLAASISHFLTAALNSHVFLSTKNVSFVFNNSLQLFLSLLSTFV